MELAAEVTWRAGKLTLRHFQAGVEVERKADETPVTLADREAERFLLDHIAQHFPDDAFLGEEFGERTGSSGWRWLLDPIDGTKSFIHGVPLYAVLVGLEDPDGEAVVGVAGFPALDEVVVAGRGEGCFWNGRRAAVSQTSDLAEACVCFTGDECFAMTGTEAVRDRFVAEARLTRGWGDAYGHILVATGRADVMLDPILSSWDCAPLLPIVEEAGGRLTDWSGEVGIHGESAVSTNAALAPRVRALLDSLPPAREVEST